MKVIYKMLIESITIVSIIGSCALFSWFAKKHFQPQIEEDLENRQKKITNDITCKRIHRN